MIKYCMLITLSFFTFTSCLSKKTSANVNQEKTDNTVLLNDIWNLVAIKDKAVTTQARLEFNTLKKQVFGNDGCNSLTGTISNVSNDEFRLSKIASTRMMCADMQIPNQFNALLNKVVFYKINTLKLYLLDQNKNKLLTFKKID